MDSAVDTTRTIPLFAVLEVLGGIALSSRHPRFLPCRPRRGKAPTAPYEANSYLASHDSLLSDLQLSSEYVILRLAVM